MDKCKDCGKELVDGICPSCKSIEDAVRAELAKSEKPKENKMSEEVKEVKVNDTERMKGLVKSLIRRDRNAAEQFSNNAQKTFTGVGYLLPVEYESQVYELMDSYGVARQYCKRHAIGTETAQLPTLISGMAMTFIGSVDHAYEGWNDGKRKPITTPEVGKVEIKIRDLAGVFPVDKNTVEDTNTNFFTLLPGLFADAAAYAEDRALMIGVDYASGGNVGGLLGLATADSGEITIAKCVGLQQFLSARALQGANYFMHPTVRVALHQELLTSTWAGRMTLEDALGYPVVLSNAMPTASDTGDVGKVLLGNMQNVYLADREQLSIDIAEEATIYNGDGTVAHALYQDNMLGFRACERIDIKCMKNDAFATLVEGS